ncbi:MAG: sterol desaturase family protein [Spirosomataceae bacterium]
MQEFIKSYLGALTSSLAIMGVAYFIVWYIFGKVLKNRKIQLSKRAGWPQIKDEVSSAAIAIFGNTIFVSIIFSLKEQGLTKLYTEGGQFGIGYEVLSVIVLILISDTWFYWFHRWMHHPKVYKYVHALHHKSLDVNPFTSTSFHVIEAILLTLWILPLVLIMPISASALGVVQALGSFNNIKSHLGYELFPQFFRIPPFNMLVTATNHSLHHTQYNGNYGLFFRFWDIVCDTELNTTQTTFEEIHQRKEAAIIDNTHYKTLTINYLKKETNDTISVYFKPADHTFYDYLAGQYLTIRVSINGKTHNRCFSLSSSPQVDDFLRITVKLKGEVSHYFFNDAKIGDNIQALYPVGDFVLKPTATAAKKYVMIAGGSGITPLYSMIRQVLRFEPQSTVTLLYANKSADRIIFKQELDLLARTNPQFNYRDFISGKQPISSEELRQHPDAHFYICGPDTLKMSIQYQLKQLNIAKSKIHVEHYADGYVPWFGLF